MAFVMRAFVRRMKKMFKSMCPECRGKKSRKAEMCIQCRRKLQSPARRVEVAFNG
jgi:hypothetical protein